MLEIAFHDYWSWIAREYFLLRECLRLPVVTLTEKHVLEAQKRIQSAERRISWARGALESSDDFLLLVTIDAIDRLLKAKVAATDQAKHAKLHPGMAAWLSSVKQDTPNNGPFVNAAENAEAAKVDGNHLPLLVGRCAEARAKALARSAVSAARQISEDVDIVDISEGEALQIVRRKETVDALSTLTMEEMRAVVLIGDGASVSMVAEALKLTVDSVRSIIEKARHAMQ